MTERDKDHIMTLIESKYKYCEVCMVWHKEEPCKLPRGWEKDYDYIRKRFFRLVDLTFHQKFRYSNPDDTLFGCARFPLTEFLIVMNELKDLLESKEAIKVPHLQIPGQAFKCCSCKQVIGYVMEGSPLPHLPRCPMCQTEMERKAKEES